MRRGKGRTGGGRRGRRPSVPRRRGGLRRSGASGGRSRTWCSGVREGGWCWLGGRTEGRQDGLRRWTPAVTQTAAAGTGGKNGRPLRRRSGRSARADFATGGRADDDDVVARVDVGYNAGSKALVRKQHGEISPSRRRRAGGREGERGRGRTEDGVLEEDLVGGRARELLGRQDDARPDADLLGDRHVGRCARRRRGVSARHERDAEGRGMQRTDRGS